MSHLLTLHDPARARENYLSGIWQTDTLYSLARRHATERGNAYAVRDSARRLTWSALVAWVDAVAADLHEAGLRRGDRVSIWLPNRLESVVILLACSRNGYVCNPSLHQNYTVAEIVTLLGASSAARCSRSRATAPMRVRPTSSAAPPNWHMKRVYACRRCVRRRSPCPAAASAMPQAARGRA
jgi:acyl-CoA synthetase